MINMRSCDTKSLLHMIPLQTTIKATTEFTHKPNSTLKNDTCRSDWCFQKHCEHWCESQSEQQNSAWWRTDGLMGWIAHTWHHVSFMSHGFLWLKSCWCVDVVALTLRACLVLFLISSVFSIMKVWIHLLNRNTQSFTRPRNKQK